MSANSTSDPFAVQSEDAAQGESAESLKRLLAEKDSVISEKSAQISELESRLAKLKKTSAEELNQIVQEHSRMKSDLDQKIELYLTQLNEMQ